MLDIDSLKSKYDNYLRNWFLTHFEGCYCYKDDEGIMWGCNGSNRLFIESDNKLFCYDTRIIHNENIFEYITKKKFTNIFSLKILRNLLISLV